MFVSWGQALPWSGGRGWRGLVGHIPRYVRLLVTMSVACTSPGTLSTRVRPARTSANTRARMSSRAPEDSSRPLRPAVKLANVVWSKCCGLCKSPTAESPASLVVRRALPFGDHQANTCIGRPRPLGHGGNAGSVGETSVSIGHRHDTLHVASVHDPHAMAPAEIADRILVVIPTRPKATLCALAGKGV